jgi:hypothetical protein
MTDQEILLNLLKLVRVQQRKITLLERYNFAMVYLLHKHAPNVYKDLPRAVEFSEDFSRHPEKYLPAGVDLPSLRTVVDVSSAVVAEQIGSVDEWQVWIDNALRSVGEAKHAR